MFPSSDMVKEEGDERSKECKGCTRLAMSGAILVWETADGMNR